MIKEQETTKKVDFHIHYESLNGNAVEEIIDSAKARELSAIALIGRLEMSDDLPKRVLEINDKGIDVLFGVEYPVKIGDKLVDLISIGFDLDNQGVRSYFGKEERRANNKELALWQKEFLEDKDFSFEGLEGEEQKLLASLMDGKISEKAIRFCYLVAKNETNSSQIMEYKQQNREIWDDTYATYSKRPGYQEIEKLESKFLWKLFFAYNQEGFRPIQAEARMLIDTVHSANGVVLYSPEGNFDQKVWSDLVELGIDGIMGWHGGQLEFNKDIIRDTRDRNLIVLGGSDFHPDLDDWQVGVGNGAMFISPRRHFELKSRLQRIAKDRGL
jgi:predicted metal-dependent phosphoesterase TrpH